jgi:hypothetical protein
VLEYLKNKKNLSYSNACEKKNKLSTKKNFLINQFLEKNLKKKVKKKQKYSSLWKSSAPSTKLQEIALPL